LGFGLERLLGLGLDLIRLRGQSEEQERGERPAKSCGRKRHKIRPYERSAPRSKMPVLTSF
jgi:hypothetical protein